MRRRDRNIEIFSMSVLDMFASAMGAFIVCCVILFPYYKQGLSDAIKILDEVIMRVTSDRQMLSAESKALTDRLALQKMLLSKMENTALQLSLCNEGMNACQVKLANTFLLVQIEWREPVDVDLHVVDSAGREFSWMSGNRDGKDFPDSRARLSIDTVGARLGGIEVWIDPAAGAGTYEIYYVMAMPPDLAFEVRGFVVDRFGRTNLASKVMSPAGSRNEELRVQAATIEITADGEVSIR